MLFVIVPVRQKRPQSEKQNTPLLEVYLIYEKSVAIYEVGRLLKTQSGVNGTETNTFLRGEHSADAMKKLQKTGAWRESPPGKLFSGFPQRTPASRYRDRRL